MESNLFAEPVAVNRPNECVFYHSLDLPISGPQKGHWDLRGQFDRYVGQAPVKGKTVLDVGAASGFLSFEAEKRGAAQVVSVDVRGAQCLDRLPFTQNLAFRNRAQWEREADKFHTAIKRSYWLAHREYKSKARAYYGNAYELPEALGQFDVVIVGQILVHLRDAIRALTSIAQRCRDLLVVAEGMTHEQEPASRLLGRASNSEVDWTFWHHSEGFYNEVLGMLGFQRAAVSVGDYLCNLDRREVEVTTMLFRRVRR